MEVTVRAIHFAAVILLFGGFVFLVGISGPAFREAAATPREEPQVLRRWLLRVALWSLAAAVASDILRLAIETANMSGLPLDQALNRTTLDAVLNHTLFGRIWKIRLAVALALGVLLLVERYRMDERARRLLDRCSTSLAGTLLAALAWAGHAAADQGFDRFMHLGADATHLLAAGAWLGALPPLVYLLAGARRRPSPGTLQVAMRATRRFSTVGILSVGCLLLSGLINSWYLAGDVPGLVGTGYGRLLLVKLALFGLMVALAATNRLRLTPQLVAAAARGEQASAALGRLARNAAIETVLGLAIVALVGALGIAIPAVHVQPAWPFPFTLSWDAVEESQGARIALFAAGAGGLVGAALAAFGAGTRRRGTAMAGLAGVGGTLALLTWLLKVPAYPSTYYRSPVRYAAATIERGMSLYEQNCAICHGARGYGDGPAAASLPVKPANLTEEHLLHHREGDLFWWLTHGISGTPMPGFGDRFSETERWDLITFLRAQAEAEQAATISTAVKPWRAIVAPDFTFQIDRRPQESLKQQRGRFIVLLVLYTPPESDARLRQLASHRNELERAGVRIVAVPVARAAENLLHAGGHDADASIIASPNGHVIATYTLFGRIDSPGRDTAYPTHVEFLIDKQGYLRGRWIPAVTQDLTQGWDRMPYLLGQIEILNREEPRPPAPEGHVH